MKSTARIVHGDCLKVLPRLRAQGAGPFDLIYVDPPFNAGGQRRARRGQGERTRGEAAYVDSWGGLSTFLTMLEERLTVFAEALSPRGSLWLHLDHRAVHDAKVVADTVLGSSSFRGEIIWVPGNGGRRRQGPNVTHQTILVYAPGKMIWNQKDPILREPFAEISLSMHFSQTDAAGRRFRERTINGRVYRYYADEGRQLGSVWLDCPAMRANTPLNKEATGYPTQKPERLLERIVRATTDVGSNVLDPMCGSGTTVAVAQRLGRQAWGIDRSALACSVARKRLKPTRPRALRDV